MHSGLTKVPVLLPKRDTINPRTHITVSECKMCYFCTVKYVILYLVLKIFFNFITLLYSLTLVYTSFALFHPCTILSSIGKQTRGDEKPIENYSNNTQRQTLMPSFLNVSMF